jgi:hypothetical protein
MNTGCYTPLCTRAAARVHLTTARRPRQPDACSFTTESRRRCCRLREHLDIRTQPRSAPAAHAHRCKSVHSAARSRPAETVLDCATRGDIASPARTPRSWPNPRCRAAGWWSRPAYVDERPERSGVRGNEPAAQPPPSAATSEACSKQTPTCSISTHDLPRSCCALDGLSRPFNATRTVNRVRDDNGQRTTLPRWVRGSAGGLKGSSQHFLEVAEGVGGRGEATAVEPGAG